MLEEISGAVLPCDDVPYGTLPEALVQVPAGRARRAQLAVATLFLVNGAAVGSWVPHIPERAHALGLNEAQLGSVLLAAGIGAVTVMPIIGPVLRRVGSRRVTIMSGLVFPALLALAILLPTVKLLVVTLFVVGLNGAAMDVSMNSHGVLIEKLLGKRTIALFHAVFSVGCFAGAGIHSFLMARGVPDRVLAPAFGAMLLLLVLLVAPLLLPQSIEQAQHAAEQAAAPPVIKKHGLRLPHPRLLLLGILCFASMVSEGAMGDWSALLLRVVHRFPNGVAGYGYTAFAACMVLGRFLGDPFTAVVGELWALRIGGLVAAGGLLLVLLAHSLPWLLLGFALAGAGIANGSPILYRTAATMPGFAPGEGLSTAVGVGYAGLLVGPPLLGLLAHAAGLPSVFKVLLLLNLTLVLAARLVRGGQQNVSAAAG